MDGWGQRQQQWQTGRFGGSNSSGSLAALQQQTAWEWEQPPAPSPHIDELPLDALECIMQQLHLQELLVSSTVSRGRRQSKP